MLRGGAIDAGAVRQLDLVVAGVIKVAANLRAVKPQVIDAARHVTADMIAQGERPRTHRHVAGDRSGDGRVATGHHEVAADRRPRADVDGSPGDDDVAGHRTGDGERAAGGPDAAPDMPADREVTSGHHDVATDRPGDRHGSAGDDDIAIHIAVDRDRAARGIEVIVDRLPASHRDIAPPPKVGGQRRDRDRRKRATDGDSTEQHADAAPHRSDLSHDHPPL